MQDEGQTPLKEEIVWFPLTLIVFVQEQVFWEIMILSWFCIHQICNFDLYLLESYAGLGHRWVKYKAKLKKQNNINQPYYCVTGQRKSMCICQMMHLNKIAKMAYIIMISPLGRQRKILLGSPCQIDYEILCGKASAVAKLKSWVNP